MKSLKVIINADDCGKDKVVNACIEKCIKAGRLTSTTVMTNQSDFLGAKKLYRDYNKLISFGCHITLDEGMVMNKSQILMDYHYIKEINGVWVFTKELWKRIMIPTFIRNELIKECSMQIEYLLDNGFRISHIDSHHHVHTAKSMIWLMPILCKKYGISNYRGIRNLFSPSINYYARQTWRLIQQIQMQKCKTTDRFASYTDIMKAHDLSFLKEGDTIEIMCHPGSKIPEFQVEIEHLLTSDTIIRGFNLDYINYNQL